MQEWGAQETALGHTPVPGTAIQCGGRAPPVGCSTHGSFRLCALGGRRRKKTGSRIVVDVQLPSWVLLFTTPWAAAGQASLPLTVS